jgi:hypothetical protein
MLFYFLQLESQKILNETFSGTSGQIIELSSHCLKYFNYSVEHSLAGFPKQKSVILHYFAGNAINYS